MYRFFALIWDASNPAVAAAAQKLIVERELSNKWLRVVTRPGVIAWHADVRAPSSTATLFNDGNAVVLGTLFSRAGAHQRSATDAAELVQKHWGRYVAIMADAKSGVVQVLRDPSGAFPCFVTRYEGVSIVFSDIEDCLSMGLRHFTMNWKYIAGAVIQPGLQSRETALNEVTEVQAGERITFHSGGAHSLERTFLWNPADIARRDLIVDSEEAVTALRQATRECVHAWAAVYPAGIVNALSGGLDSAIVLSCLKDAPTSPTLSCLNYFSLGRDEDERRFARLAAEHANARLIEHQIDWTSVPLENVMSIRPSVKPWSYLYELQHSAHEGNVARELGATAIFTGGGGDSVFYQGRADLAAPDALFTNPARFWRAAVDGSRVARCSVAAIIRQAVSMRLGRKVLRPLGADIPPRTLIRKEVFEQVEATGIQAHPWMAHAKGLPPGKLWHIASLGVPPAFYNSFEYPGNPEKVCPLVSQPLIEVALRIPTYVLISGGRDRAIARRAFADAVPAEIIRRRTKGNVDNHSRALLDKNLGFARDVLLDGLLVREGLLDRERLHLYLSRDRSPLDFEYNEILHQHLCAEAWLQRWKGISQQGAELARLAG